MVGKSEGFPGNGHRLTEQHRSGTQDVHSANPDLSLQPLGGDLSNENVMNCGSSHRSSAVTKLTTIREDAGLTPWPRSVG